MKALVIRPRYNEEGKKDVTHAFEPESERFIEVNKLDATRLVFDNKKPLPNRAEYILSSLKAANKVQRFDVIAFFCHGWRDGIQAGFGTKGAKMQKNLEDLISVLRLNEDQHIALYCCSTGASDPNISKETASGSGDNSFADKLRDKLCQYSAVECRVVAHTTAAHTTMNPNVIFFDGMGSSIGGAGGYFPVPPNHELWKKWRLALRTDFRFKFPFMSVGEIHSFLDKFTL